MPECKTGPAVFIWYLTYWQWTKIRKSQRCCNIVSDKSNWTCKLPRYKVTCLEKQSLPTRYAAINKNVLSYPAEIPTVFTPGWPCHPGTAEQKRWSCWSTPADSRFLCWRIFHCQPRLTDRKCISRLRSRTNRRRKLNAKRGERARRWLFKPQQLKWQRVQTITF